LPRLSNHDILIGGMFHPMKLAPSLFGCCVLSNLGLSVLFVLLINCYVNSWVTRKTLPRYSTVREVGFIGLLRVTSRINLIISRSRCNLNTALSCLSSCKLMSLSYVALRTETLRCLKPGASCIKLGILCSGLAQERSCCIRDSRLLIVI